MSNRAYDFSVKQEGLSKTLNFGDTLLSNILSEILSHNSDLFSEIDLHDKKHKITLMKRIIFCFICIKGKHACRTWNKENNSLIRHSRTKEVIFKHE